MKALQTAKPMGQSLVSALLAMVLGLLGGGAAPADAPAPEPSAGGGKQVDPKKTAEDSPAKLKADLAGLDERLRIAKDVVEDEKRFWEKAVDELVAKVGSAPGGDLAAPTKKLTLKKKALEQAPDNEQARKEWNDALAELMSVLAKGPDEKLRDAADKVEEKKKALDGATAREQQLGAKRDAQKKRLDDANSSLAEAARPTPPPPAVTEPEVGPKPVPTPKPQPSEKAEPSTASGKATQGGETPEGAEGAKKGGPGKEDKAGAGAPESKEKEKGKEKGKEEGDKTVPKGEGGKPEGEAPPPKQEAPPKQEPPPEKPPEAPPEGPPKEGGGAPNFDDLMKLLAGPDDLKRMNPAKLKSLAAEAEKEVTALKGERQTLITEVSRLQKQVTTWEETAKEWEKAKGKWKAWEAQFEQAKLDKKAAEEKATEAAAATKSAEGQRDRAKSDLEALGKLFAFPATKGIPQEKLKADMAALKEAVPQTYQFIAGLLEKEKTLKEQNEALDAGVKKLTREKEQLGKSSGLSEALVGELKDARARAEKDLKEARGLTSALTADKAKLTDEMDELSKSAEGLGGRMADIGRAHKIRTVILAVLLAALCAAGIAFVDRRRRKVALERDAAREQASKLEQQAAKGSEHVQSLNEKLNQARAEVAQQKQETVKALERTRKLEQALRLVFPDLRVTPESMAAAGQRLQDTEGEIRKLRDTKLDLEGQLRDKRRELDELSRREMDIADAHRKLQLEMQDLVRQTDSHKQMLADERRRRQEEVAQKVAEIDDLAGRLQATERRLAGERERVQVEKAAELEGMHAKFREAQSQWASERAAFESAQAAALARQREDHAAAETAHATELDRLRSQQKQEVERLKGDYEQRLGRIWPPGALSAAIDPIRHAVGAGIEADPLMPEASSLFGMIHQMCGVVGTPDAREVAFQLSRAFYSWFYRVANADERWPEQMAGWLTELLRDTRTQVRVVRVGESVSARLHSIEGNRDVVRRPQSFLFLKEDGAPYKRAMVVT